MLCNIVRVRLHSLVIVWLHQLFLQAFMLQFIFSTNFSPSQSWKAVRNQPRFSSSNLWQVDNQAKLRCLIADGFPSTKSRVSEQTLFFKDDGRVVSGLTASLPACTQCPAQSKPRTAWEFWAQSLTHSAHGDTTDPKGWSHLALQKSTLLQRWPAHQSRATQSSYSISSSV